MKRIALIISAASILFLLLLGTGSVTFYSQVSNCGTCHEMKRFYDSWKVSSHSSVSCDICHQRSASEGVISLEGTTIKKLIMHFAKEEIDPQAYISRENCLRCHSSIKRSITLERNSLVLNPHPVHLENGLTCTQCHKHLVHAENASMGSSSQMRVCVECHKSRDISSGCATCHFNSYEHVDKIAQAGGYRLDEGESCGVCHVQTDTCRTDHGKVIKNIGGYKGAITCLQCHVDAVKEVSASSHSKLKANVAHVPGIAGEMGMANLASSPAIWAYQLKRKDGSLKSGGCGYCHIGGSDFPSKEVASAIDCLVCHAEKYDMKKRRVVKTGSVMKWAGDESADAVASVGKPSPDYCYRCHGAYMDNMRGTSYTPETDVHARANMSCQNCHVTIKHKIAKGKAADLMANDIPEISISCTHCHIGHRHGIEKVDLHLYRLACQSCHIGKVAGAVEYDLTEGTDTDGDGIFEKKVVERKEVNPVFFWFNGQSDTKGRPTGNRAEKNAKIYPFKIVTLKYAVDPKTKKALTIDPVSFARTGTIAMVVVEPTGSDVSGDLATAETAMVKQLSHGIDSRGLGCDSCHSERGIMDFKALEYSSDEAKKLSRSQRMSR